MSDCEYCGYYWADRDETGHAISERYCHYEGPDAWAPCEQDEMTPCETELDDEWDCGDIFF